MVTTHDADDTLRVATFNVRYDTPADGDRSWTHRRERVASLLRFHRPDLVGLQEPLAHQYDFLRERLPAFAWSGVGRRDGDREGEFNPVAARSSRATVADSGTRWLSESPREPGSTAWDAAYPRMVTWAELELRDADPGAADRALYLFNTHFSHRSERARVESARAVRELVGEIAGDAPAVVTGDCNCVEGSEPYGVLTAENGPGRRLRDTFHAAGDAHYGPDATFNRFEGDPTRKIDYVFVTDEFAVHQHGVVADCHDGPPASDHAAVVADVTLE